MRLVGCIRVSRVNGRTGETFISTKVQRDQIELYAAAMGHHIVAWQEDLDQPGSNLNRPGFQAALATVRAGDADGIIAAKLDRITRSMADLGRLLEWAHAENWNLIAVDLGLDLRTPTGRLVGNVLGSVAEWELQRRRQDWQTARERAVGRGVHIASRCPTGYRRQQDGRLEPDPVTGPAVVALFERRAAGDGWKTLAQTLTDRGVMTPYGNPVWTPAAVTKLVRNRVYLGEARSGGFVHPGAHPALVDQGLWDAAQTAAVRPVSRVGEVPLLAGLVRCAGCRQVVKADSMRDGRGEKLRMYRCRAVSAAGRCPTPVAILARVLEPYVEQQVVEWLETSGPAAEATVANSAHQDAVLEHDAAVAELHAYLESEVVEIAGREGFERGLLVRRARVDESAARVAEARGRVVALGEFVSRDLAGMWAGFGRGRKAEVFGALLDCVVVWPHRSGCPVSDRVRVLFRGEAPAGLPGRGRRVPFECWPGDRPGDVGVVFSEDAKK